MNLYTSSPRNPRFIRHEAVLLLLLWSTSGCLFANFQRNIYTRNDRIGVGLLLRILFGNANFNNLDEKTSRSNLSRDQACFDKTSKNVFLCVLWRSFGEVVRTFQSISVLKIITKKKRIDHSLRLRNFRSD